MILFTVKPIEIKIFFIWPPYLSGRTMKNKAFYFIYVHTLCFVGVPRLMNFFFNNISNEKFFHLQTKTDKSVFHSMFVYLLISKLMSSCMLSNVICIMNDQQACLLFSHYQLKLLISSKLLPRKGEETIFGIRDRPKQYLVTGYSEGQRGSFSGFLCYFLSILLGVQQI